MVNRTGASRKADPEWTSADAVPTVDDPRLPTHPRRVDGYTGALTRRLRIGWLGPAPAVLGLITIWIVFQTLDSNFLSPRSLSSLSVNIVGTGMIAVGLVFVLLLGEIDLSVGSVAGLATVIFAVMAVDYGMPEWLAIIVAVLSGAAIGALQGLLFAKTGLPSFIVTLAGLLGWIGLMLHLLGANATLHFDENGLVASLTSRHISSPAAVYGLAAVGTAAYFLVTYRASRRRRNAGMDFQGLARITERTGILALVAFAVAFVLNRFQGLPLAFLLFLIVVVGLDYVLRRTGYGRKVFAVGGGAQSAHRVGIDVAAVRVSVFVISGAMAATGGLFLASPIASTVQSSGSTPLLLNAIAAAVIGGTSLFGGHGTTWSAFLGILAIESIALGMDLVGTKAAVQYMITAGVLLAAVIIDSMSRRMQQAQGRP